jgi:glycosyltransferase involved in cell wall biosynthesis
MKKNILISVYDMEIGGIERSLINMLEAFDYERYNVDLLVFEHRGDFMKLIPDQVNLIPQINAYTVFRKPISQCVKEGYYASSLVRLVAKYAAIQKAKVRKLEEGPGYIQMQLVSKYSSLLVPKLKKNYDVSISYAWPHDLVADRIPAKRKIAWIHTDYSKLEIDNQIDLEMWNKFDYIAAVSEECCNSFLLTYPSLKNKVFILENITSPTFITSMANEVVAFNKMPGEAFSVLSVGRLSYVKGFDLAVKALRLLHDKGFTNIRWYVVGYGGYEQDLMDLIKSYQLEDSFILLGKQANPYPYIKACDLYIQPSRYEGKAVTVTEAKILNRPIIITNYPTSASQVTHGKDGIICGSNPEAIADAIKDLYIDSDLRNLLVKNTKKENYSNNDEIEKLYEVIKSQ